jgi:hypothetical protein
VAVQRAHVVPCPTPHGAEPQSRRPGQLGPLVWARSRQYCGVDCIALELHSALMNHCCGGQCGHYSNSTKTAEDCGRAIKQFARNLPTAISFYQSRAQFVKRLELSQT